MSLPEVGRPLTPLGSWKDKPRAMGALMGWLNTPLLTHSPLNSSGSSGNRRSKVHAVVRVQSLYSKAVVFQTRVQYRKRVVNGKISPKRCEFVRNLLAVTKVPAQTEVLPLGVSLYTPRQNDPDVIDLIPYWLNPVPGTDHPGIFPPRYSQVIYASRHFLGKPQTPDDSSPKVI